MTNPDPRELAQRFLEVIPPLMHGMRSALHGDDGPMSAMTFPQLRCLGSLAHGPSTLGELATLHRVSPPTMSRMVNGLVERGWVERGVDPEDRRQVVLSLSPTGEALRGEVFACGSARLAEQLAELTPEERQALSEALEGLARTRPAAEVLPRERAS